MNEKKWFFISDSAGQIVTMLVKPEQQTQSTNAIIYPFNPTEGGSMTHKVVITMAAAFERLGMKQYALMIVVLDKARATMVM